MRYVGGKSKLAKQVAEAVLSNSESRETYLEPFVGGGAVFSRLAPHFSEAFAGDLHPDLILMWNAVLHEGWEPPTEVSEARYAELRHERPSAERGFVGFGGSFGGKWFGGYARGGYRSDGTPRNHQAESARAVLKIRDSLRLANVAEFRAVGYQDWSPQPGTVIYCDPPYESTQGYSVGGFNSADFHAKMEQWVEGGCEVFVSEYNAPEHWDTVWERTHRQSLTTPEQGRGLTTERLYKVEPKRRHW